MSALAYYSLGVLIGIGIIIALVILVSIINSHAEKIDLLSLQIENANNRFAGLVDVLPVKLVKAEPFDTGIVWRYTYEYNGLEESVESRIEAAQETWPENVWNVDAKIKYAESDDFSDILETDEEKDDIRSVYTTPEFQAYLDSLEMISKDTLVSYIGLEDYDKLTKLGIIKLPVVRWSDIIDGYKEHILEENQ